MIRSLAPPAMRRGLVLAVLAALGGAATAGGELHFGVVWYSNPTDDAVLSLALQRYQVGVCGKENASSKVKIKTLNPDFQWYVYNSGTDNYVSPPSAEHLALWDLAIQKGCDPEEAYMHYWDDTRFVLQGDTLLVPGWGGGSATDPAQARIPVYLSNLSRRVVNFSSPRARQLQKELFVQLALDTPFPGSTIYPDGIFLDNSASRIFNYGTVLSGGHVLESPGHPLIASPEFVDWYWNDNLAPFLSALEDTLEASASWSKDGRRKRLMINVANIWDDGYVTYDVADILFMEFQYNPIRAFGLDAVPEAYRRDALAASAGITCFYSASTSRSLADYPGSFSYADVLLGNLAWYLTTRTEKTVFFEMGSASPHLADWDSLTWRGCIDTARSDLGEAASEPYELARGTDPLGNPYVVTARQYQGGLVALRNRGDWNQGIETETAVAVPLPAPLYPLTPSGFTLPRVSSISLRSGQGAILLADPVAVRLLSFTAAREGGDAVLRWEVGETSADHAGFYVYREALDGPRVRLTPDLLAGRSVYGFTDHDPPAGPATYWLAELSRTGEVTWYGPVALEPASPPIPVLVLSQNRPNPFRSTTSIRFTLDRSGRATVRLFDLEGRVVRELLDAVLPAGEHEIDWNGLDARGSRVSPGVYLYRLVSPGGILTRKLDLLP